METILTRGRAGAASKGFIFLTATVSSFFLSYFLSFFFCKNISCKPFFLRISLRLNLHLLSFLLLPIPFPLLLLLSFFPPFLLLFCFMLCFLFLYEPDRDLSQIKMRCDCDPALLKEWTLNYCVVAGSFKLRVGNIRVKKEGRGGVGWGGGEESSLLGDSSRFKIDLMLCRAV